MSCEYRLFSAILFIQPLSQSNSSKWWLLRLFWGKAYVKACNLRRSTVRTVLIGLHFCMYYTPSSPFSHFLLFPPPPPHSHSSPSPPLPFPFPSHSLSFPPPPLSLPLPSPLPPQPDEYYDPRLAAMEDALDQYGYSAVSLPQNQEVPCAFIARYIVILPLTMVTIGPDVCYLCINTNACLNIKFSYVQSVLRMSLSV